MRDLHSVRLACNGDHGVFAGCVRRIDVTDIITLDAISAARPPRLALVEFDGMVRMLRLSGRNFPVRGFTNYAGNESTAAVVMEACVLAELLNYARQRGFVADGGLQDAAIKWDSGRFTADFLRGAL